MNKHFLLRGSLGLTLSIGVFAQHPGTPPGSGPGTVGPGNPTPGGVMTQPHPGQMPDISDQEQTRPMVLMGKVVMEDGTPPPDPVVIQLVCHGMPRSIAYTDGKGHFSADLNSPTARAMFADASQGFDTFGGPTATRSSNSTQNNVQVGAGALRQQDLLSCELQAYQAGFHSEVIQLGTRRSNDNPDVGVLFLRRLANVEGLTISATSTLAPKDAKKAFEKARKEEAQEKWPEAQKEFEKAASIYPKYAAAWYELGNVQQAQNEIAAARQSYARALEADPRFVIPYGQLAAIAAREKKWQEVADNTNHLLQLDPVDFPQAWLYNAVANYGMHNWDAAAKSAREGLSHDPSHRFPKLNQVLGAALAMERDYPGSVQNLKDYLHYAPDATDADLVQKQLTQLEKVLEPQEDKQ
jgi:tetratricopeptide (TPR) repeat protein